MSKSESSPKPGSKNKDTSYSHWRDNVMDERLAYLDAAEKYELYLRWKSTQLKNEDI